MARNAYAHLPERFRAAQKFRLDVLRREAHAIDFLTRSWATSIKSLQLDIDRMTKKIEQARAKGETVNKDWLRRQTEYKRLQSQIIERTNTYSQTAAARMRLDTSWAARVGADNALTLTQLSFAEPVRGLVSFRVLDSQTVTSIAGRVAPGTPTGRLIDQIGADTADSARNVLIDGITRGRNVNAIGRDLSSVANIPMSRAQTIARTEIFGAYRDSHLEHISLNSDFLDGWIWFAHLETCCGGCLAMNGQVFSTEAFMEAHPNCACEPIPQPKSFADMGLDPSLDDMYPDTFDPATMVQDSQNVLDGSLKDLTARFGPGKAAAIKDGTIQLSQLSKVIKNDTFGNSIVEAPLKDLVKAKV